MKGIFITGTDTHVGKTYIGCKIAAELTARNINVVPRKPVESGCKKIDNQLVAEDALALKNASKYSGTLEQVCPFRFEPAISPLRASRLAGKKNSVKDLTSACLSHIDTASDFLLVEGAGGFYSPLCEDGLNSDLAQSLNLPVILVANDKLGCINQTLLNVRAIESCKLSLLCVVLNQPDTSEKNQDMNNMTDLSQFLSCPIIHISPDLPLEAQIADLSHIILQSTL